MKTSVLIGLFTGVLLSAATLTANAASAAADRVKTASGVVEGTGVQSTGVRSFKGIPFAQPPVGDLRWKPPQPLKKWEGVKQTVQFGPRCMQPPIFSDMVFRSNGMSEDCLYLNVWTPAKKGNEHLPVLVYFYGGGFVAGDGSEFRYDGENMAAKGIVTVTVNYRLGVFGFLAHPELSKESPYHGSGNYALMDQSAALQWVRQNIRAFGGDPRRVTIAGESAGSVSVSAQMASPLSKDLINGAIGESGSILGTLSAVPLAMAEQEGVKFATSVGATSLAALRAMTTEQLFQAANKSPVKRFPLTIDGRFFPESPSAIFAAGKQAHVPLLVGWNSEEMTGRALFGREEATLENYQQAVKKAFGERADEVLKLYAASTPEEVMAAATDLAGDRFIAYSTWKWADVHSLTGGQPVYRYLYTRPRPATTSGDSKTPVPRGAVHSAEIEYALGNLATNKVFAWTPDDYKVSKVMQEYFANFIKTGNPNGAGLTAWPTLSKDNAQFMRIDVEPRVEQEKHRERYLFLDRLSAQEGQGR